MILIAALAAQLALPACIIKTPGAASDSAHGQWVREATPYVLADPTGKPLLKHVRGGDRDYLLVFGGEAGVLLDFGYRDEDGSHETQMIALGPGELASFMCVLSEET